MHSNGEELHPNWRALATVHLPLKRFVKAADGVGQSNNNSQKHEIIGVQGVEAKEFYEKLIADSSPKAARPVRSTKTDISITPKNTENKLPFDRRKFFRYAQEGDAISLRNMQLKIDELNSCDEYGWTPLMMAACEGAVETVKVLLQLGADKTIKDKTGKTALDLANRKSHIVVANILKSNFPLNTKQKKPCNEKKAVESFYCEICQRSFTETTRLEHQTSTVHQFNLKSTLPTNKLERFNITQRNRGLQIMVKQGWNKESGLGPAQSGRLYPVKTVIRNKRTGLGVEQPPARVTHFEAYDLRATQRRGCDYYQKKPLNRNDIRREKVRDWKQTRRLRNELS